jgi:hypothetical protein
VRRKRFRHVGQVWSANEHRTPTDSARTALRRQQTVRLPYG